VSHRLAVEDNYYYLGRSCPAAPEIMDNGEEAIRPLQFIQSMGRNKQSNVTFLAELRQRFLYHQQLGHHVILSTEHIASKRKLQIANPQVWKELLQGFQVKVIVGYRHFFEWYPSLYYQYHLGNIYRKLWPHEGGNFIPSLVEYIEEGVAAAAAASRRKSSNTHMSVGTYLKWSQYFDDVEILDLHRPGDVFVHFVCHCLPTATSTCQHVRQLADEVSASQQHDHNQTDNQTITVVRRVSSNLFAERIVDAAYQHFGRTQLPRKKRGYTKKAKDALETQQLSSFDTNTESQFMWCLSPALEERFHQASLLFLETMHTTPGNNSNSNSPLWNQHNWTLAVEDHRTLFNKAKAKGKFCDINTTHILLNDTFTTQVFGVSQRDPSHSWLG
jgi:hypothetical protein